jgi:hypothetical protein
MTNQIHDCHLLKLLEEDNLPLLEWYERNCTAYIAAVSDVAQAIEKIKAELLGTARRNSRYDLNARLADLFVEIAAVAALSRRGCSHFVPLVPPVARKGKPESRPDFKMSMRSQDSADGELRDAYLEVKNLRAPIGISDTFARLYRELVPIYPSLSRCFIRITHYSDNTIEDDQAEWIEEFLLSLAASPTPSSRGLKMPSGIEIDIEVAIVDSKGGVCLIRPLGGDHPDGPFIDRQALEKKVADTVRKAISQLSPYAPNHRMLAINISTADSILPTAIIQLLRDTVQREGDGEVECFILHHHHALPEAYGNI